MSTRYEYRHPAYDELKAQPASDEEWLQDALKVLLRLRDAYCWSNNRDRRSILGQSDWFIDRLEARLKAE